MKERKSESERARCETIRQFVYAVRTQRYMKWKPTPVTDLQQQIVDSAGRGTEHLLHAASVAVRNVASLMRGLSRRPTAMAASLKVACCTPRIVRAAP